MHDPPRLQAAAAPAGVALSAGRLLHLIRSESGVTRAQLLARTGMSRTTLTERLEQLTAARLIRESRSTDPTGGRPAKIIEFDAVDKVVLTIDLGHTHARVAAVSIAGVPLAATEIAVKGRSPSELVLTALIKAAEKVLQRSQGWEVVGIGFGVPAPVVQQGQTHWDSSPMRGWSERLISDTLQGRWPVPLVLENDARALAIGEDSLMSSTESGADILLAVKFGWGIGAGVVMDGQPLRGSTGAAGDIGHTRVTRDGPRCRCGRRGCLAAYASGRAILRQLRHRRVTSLSDVVTLLDGKDPEVTATVRRAGEAIGHVLGGLLACINPSVVVLGGLLGHHPLVVRSVRAEVKNSTLPRVIERTSIQPSRLGEDAGTIGMARLVVQSLYSPEAVDSRLRLPTE
ncbi:ROK family transcriptional regulator [Micromonospora sp. CPCC 205556]|uniref:ROK family transcriptional regulator n=1 Tax=Micromonospora sp. CPCC 205556 TaxID=3122398 RepID=UPI002FF2B190